MKIRSTSSKIGDWIFVIICVIISIICVVPMLNLAAKSLSGTEYLIRHDVFLWPKGFNIDAYKTVLSDSKYQSFRVDHDTYGHLYAPFTYDDGALRISAHIPGTQGTRCDQCIYYDHDVLQRRYDTQLPFDERP